MTFEISRKESNETFRNHNPMDRQLDFPEELDDVCIEWIENVVSGELNRMTRKDNRKYEYRVRACRQESGAILMDTGKFVTGNAMDKVIRNFINNQKEIDNALGRGK